MTTLLLLTLALLFGGMLLFSAGFAPVLFKTVGQDMARKAIRGTFPYFYLFVIAVSALAAAVSLAVDPLTAAVCAFLVISTLYARQVLMHQINAATDAGDRARFSKLHGVSVVLQLAQIALVGWLIARFL